MTSPQSPPIPGASVHLIRPKEVDWQPVLVCEKDLGARRGGEAAQGRVRE